MKLGNILSTATDPIAPRAVKFRVLVSGPGIAQKSTTAKAVFAFVDEAARLDSLRKARSALKGSYTEEDLTEEENYWFLLAALRDADDPITQFCPDAEMGTFKSSLILQQVRWLLGEYKRFVKDEYPELATPEQHQELKAQALGE